MADRRRALERVRERAVAGNCKLDLVKAKGPRDHTVVMRSVNAMRQTSRCAWLAKLTLDLGERGVSGGDAFGTGSARVRRGWHFVGPSGVCYC